jgi:putative transposase
MKDRETSRALLRFQAISAFLAKNPPRGQRGKMLEELASRPWTTESGETVKVTVETLRSWLRRWRRGGFEALRDRSRVRGKGKLDEDLVEKACRLKREVPSRSIDQVISIMEEMGMAGPGKIRRSTLHRALRERGLSRRALPVFSDKDLDRFQADHGNDLWQSDMLVGPWLEDPARPGKNSRTYLYSFIDDASRLCLAGKFYFRGDLPALELVFKRALQRYGIPRAVYFDNAQVYRSVHIRQVCAELGIHRIIHTRPYRPMGHGKAEAFNHFVTSNFIAEVSASTLSTLDQLNEAFIVFLDLKYNRRRHAELGCTPLERWTADAAKIRYADEKQLQTAFLWREERTPDKCGVLQLHGVRYQVSSALAARRIQVRYDPEHLDQVDILRDGKFVERAQPLEIFRHRRPVPVVESVQEDKKPTDYLGFLLEKHHEKLRDEAAVEGEREFLSLLASRIDPGVMDEEQSLAFYRRFGPLPLENVAAALDEILSRQPADLHLTSYLEAIASRLVHKE